MSGITFSEKPSIDASLQFPSPTPEKLRELSKRLGLPEDLTGREVLELFSGDTDQSFKPEVLSRGGSYTGVDKNANTGKGHISGDVYDVVARLEPQHYNYVIMSGPLLWNVGQDERKWRRENRTRLATPVLRNPEAFMRLLTACVRLVMPSRGNCVSIANGFIDSDVDEIWRRIATSLPRYNEWVIHSPKTGDTVPVFLVNAKHKISETLSFPEHAIQLVHI